LACRHTIAFTFNWISVLHLIHCKCGQGENQWNWHRQVFLTCTTTNLLVKMLLAIGSVSTLDSWIQEFQDSSLSERNAWSHCHKSELFGRYWNFNLRQLPSLAVPLTWFILSQLLHLLQLIFQIMNTQPVLPSYGEDTMKVTEFSSLGTESYHPLTGPRYFIPPSAILLKFEIFGFMEDKCFNL
jgi:hypothetical protein